MRTKIWTACELAIAFYLYSLLIVLVDVCPNQKRSEVSILFETDFSPTLFRIGSTPTNENSFPDTESRSSDKPKSDLHFILFGRMNYCSNNLSAITRHLLQDQHLQQQACRLQLRACRLLQPCHLRWWLSLWWLFRL